jgi:endonuclease-3
MPARKPPAGAKSAARKAVLEGRLVAPLTAKAKPGRRARKPKPVDRATRHEIFRRFAADNPEPRGELEHVDPYTLLVAVVLSAQATDKSVNIATERLFQTADTPQKMVELGEERLREFIRTIGLYRMKAKNVVALSRRLVEEHGGIVPPVRAVLESLPGVGRKSASVVLNNAFGEPTIAVDTHVFRVSHRIPLVIANAPDAVQEGLEKIVPVEFRRHAHHWLILHGRYVCKARRPECYRCLIQDLCRFEPKTPPPQP